MRSWSVSIWTSCSAALPSAVSALLERRRELRPRLGELALELRLAIDECDSAVERSAASSRCTASSLAVELLLASPRASPPSSCCAASSWSPSSGLDPGDPRLGLGRARRSASSIVPSRLRLLAPRPARRAASARARSRPRLRVARVGIGGAAQRLGDVLRHRLRHRVGGARALLGVLGAPFGVAARWVSAPVARAAASSRALAALGDRAVGLIELVDLASAAPPRAPRPRRASRPRRRARSSRRRASPRRRVAASPAAATVFSSSTSAVAPGLELARHLGELGGELRRARLGRLRAARRPRRARVSSCRDLLVRLGELVVGGLRRAPSASATFCSSCAARVSAFAACEFAPDRLRSAPCARICAAARSFSAFSARARERRDLLGELAVPFASGLAGSTWAGPRAPRRARARGSRITRSDLGELLGRGHARPRSRRRSSPRAPSPSSMPHRLELRRARAAQRVELVAHAPAPRASPRRAACSATDRAASASSSATSHALELAGSASRSRLIDGFDDQSARSARSRSSA